MEPRSKTALLLIATGPRYWAFAHNLIASAKQYFIPHDVILFTDNESDFFDVRFKIRIPTAGYPKATLNRYHTFLVWKHLLKDYDYLFYSDVDMRFVAPVQEDILADGITATLHPGFAVERSIPCYVSTVGTPERRLQSACRIPESATNVYYCGGFNGGTSESYLAMAECVRDYIDRDAVNGIVPLWHDESGLNKYLWLHPPAKVLTPSYCHPEGYSMRNGGYGWEPETYPPILLALNKDNSDRWEKPVKVERPEPSAVRPDPPEVKDKPVSGPQTVKAGAKSRTRPRMMKGNRWSR